MKVLTLGELQQTYDQWSREDAPLPQVRSAVGHFERGQTSKSDLPLGKACGDCAHCERCCALFARIPADQVCDWDPSRFMDKNQHTETSVGRNACLPVQRGV